MGVNRLFSILKRDARGNWSDLADYWTGEEVGNYRSTLAMDPAGSLYVAAYIWHHDLRYLSVSRIQKRDAQGMWSVIDGHYVNPSALVVDAAANLYVAERSLQNYAGNSLGGDRIQKRDAQGKWSVIATSGAGLGQVANPSGLAVDGAGNLYVADSGNHRVLMYTPDR